MSRALLASEAESFYRSGQKQYEDTQSNGNEVAPLFISSLENKIN
jgi:hypothetical protein